MVHACPRVCPVAQGSGGGLGPLGQAEWDGRGPQLGAKEMSITNIESYCIPETNIMLYVSYISVEKITFLWNFM